MTNSAHREYDQAMKSIWVIRIINLTVAVASLALFIHTTLPNLGKTDFDDAYMFLRYAKHWLAFGEFSWNPGEGPTYGMTSPLHLLAVTTLRGMTDLADATVLTGLSYGAAFLALGVLLVAGFRICSCRGYWFPLLLAPCLLLGRMYPFHSLTGMESTTSLLMNSLVVLTLVWKGGRIGRLQLGSCLLVAYLAYLARPDNGLYGILLPPLYLVACDRQNRSQALLYTALFIALLASDAVIKKWLFGSYVPLPVYAKSSGFYRGYLGGDKWDTALFTLQFLRDSLPFLLIIACMASRELVRYLVAVFLPMLLTFAYYTTVNQIMGWNARYYFPSLPYLILIALLALRSFSDQPSRSGDEPVRQWAPRLVGAMFLLVVTLSPMVEKSLTEFRRNHIAAAVHKYEPRTVWSIESPHPLPPLGWVRAIHAVDALLAELGDQVVVAASENGFIGAQHPRKKIIDLAGLNDPYIAQKGFSAKYLFGQTPDILWLPPPDYSYACSEILDATDFRLSYEYYPGVFDYGLALRKDSRIYPATIEALRKHFTTLYPGQDLLNYCAQPTKG